MEKRIIECVPNFSEGRNKAVIQQITSAIEALEQILKNGLIKAKREIII